jgi:hypothetical protein
LQIEIHSDGQIRPACNSAFEYSPLEPGVAVGPRKSYEFRVTKTQSPSRIRGKRLWSCQSALPSHRRWDASWCWRARAR